MAQFIITNKHPEIKTKIEDTITLPKVILVNEFTEASSKQFYTDMCEAENNYQDIIPIFIDSYGGEVYSLLSMIDCIKSSQKTIATIAISKSMSCGAILLSHGKNGYRFASPSSSILIHDVSKWSSGKISELKADSKEAERLNDLIYNMLDRNCGQKDGYFKDIVHENNHADWYLTSEEARQHNLVNHICVPHFKALVSYDLKFEFCEQK